MSAPTDLKGLINGDIVFDVVKLLKARNSPPSTVKMYSQMLYYVLNTHIGFKYYSHLFKMAFT